jgi:hypothetical protein
MEAIYFSETSIYFQRDTRRYTSGNNTPYKETSWNAGRKPHFYSANTLTFALTGYNFANVD